MRKLLSLGMVTFVAVLSQGCLVELPTALRDDDCEVGRERRCTPPPPQPPPTPAACPARFDSDVYDGSITSSSEWQVAVELGVLYNGVLAEVYLSDDAPSEFSIDGTWVVHEGFPAPTIDPFGVELWYGGKGCDEATVIIDVG